ncbi:IS66 family insertion sequence element accessory protein TnpB [Mesorhizobium sp. M3A.F.Ca.ET.201.01.1.1]|uniref:IS66 family insertion sequence element accessory protein TnpB n=1 Tax=Mesorhizobium sp. M3A.F.Ca.ET.201.01.1.1 TaxID=2563946 RepID=UPI0026D67B1D
MISIPSGVKVWLATGYTDMRKGFPGLSLMVQETLSAIRTPVTCSVSAGGRVT